MNNKNPLFITVLIICVICLILGITTPIKNVKNNIENTEKQGKINTIIGTNKIAIITLEGMITSSNPANMFEENSSLNALKSIIKAEKDESVKGIILQINSPGGTVGMSQRLYNAILKVREKKPIIALMDDMATSGGYYIASAADRIVALPGTMTGSIGVIMSTMDLHRFLSEKLSINENVIKSGKYKDIGSSTRIMTEDEKYLLQDIVNDSYQQFKEAIIIGRINRQDDYKVEKKNLTVENLNKYADGRVFTGRQALSYGFIDSTGGMDSAKTMIEKMSAQKFQKGTIGKYPLTFVDYSEMSGFLNLLGIKTQNSTIDNILPTSMKYAGKPLYLWE